jgi:dTDP-4-amino-4,6-dideoxygalactose transaminase
MSIIRKLRRLRLYWFQVPWCVPPWGLKEMRAGVRCMLRGTVVTGGDGARFAASAREAVGRRFAIPVGRGRDAIWLALRTLDLGPEDEVVVPSYVCGSVPEAVRMAGARVVWADVGEHLVVTLDSIRSAMSPRTRCVIIPHLFGNTAPLETIEPFLRERGVVLIDDAAQAFGMRRARRPLGSFGQFGIVCGGPGKPLVTPAGGVLLTDDAELFRRATTIPLPLPQTAVALRRFAGFWFWRRWRRYTAILEAARERIWAEAEPATSPPGGIANLDAALLLSQWERFESISRCRSQRATRMRALLHSLHWRDVSDPTIDGSPLKLILLLPEDGPPMQEALDAFAAAGVECQCGYIPCHLKDRTENAPILPFSEQIWARVLCIPLDTDLRNAGPLKRLSERWPRTGALIGCDAADTYSG